MPATCGIACSNLSLTSLLNKYRWRFIRCDEQTMPLKQQTKFSISIVSHGHRDLIMALLTDLVRIRRNDIEVILTWNLKQEDNVVDSVAFPFPILSAINDSPRGFAANHNAAFRQSSGEHFVILNPDIRLPEDPFATLLSILDARRDVICAPTILNTRNELEDSARFFPSPLGLAKKAAAKAAGIRLRLPAIPMRDALLHPDWVAGMFLVVPRRIYVALGGLSERYFLYYEDVDFCARAQLQGIDIIVTPEAIAIHDARRESHHNLRFLSWHFSSALKFFTSRAYLTLRLENLFGRKFADRKCRAGE
jgi:N-acetylglucosaminyl-diphospho-decaprenol L-rhamnosyltransferase